MPDSYPLSSTSAPVCWPTWPNSATASATPPTVSVDEQAMARPSASELNLGGLVKHAALVEQAWIGFIQDGDTSVFVSRGGLGRRVPSGPARRWRTCCGSRPTWRNTQRRSSTGWPISGLPWRLQRRGSRGFQPGWCGRRAGCSSTSLRRRPVTPATLTSSASRSTAPRAGRRWRAEGWPDLPGSEGAFADRQVTHRGGGIAVRSALYRPCR